MGIIEIKKIENKFERLISLIKNKNVISHFTSDDIKYIKSEIRDHYQAFIIIKKTIEKLGSDIPNGSFDEQFNHLENFTKETLKLLEK